MLKKIIGFFVGRWVEILGVLIIVATFYLWAYGRGHEAAAIGCATNQLKGNNEAEKIHATVENQVNDMADDDLAGELSRWMRVD